MVKNLRAKMFSRKEPELIDLDSSDDEKVDEDSVVIIELDESDITGKGEIHDVSSHSNPPHTYKTVDSNNKLNQPPEIKAKDVLLNAQGVSEKGAVIPEDTKTNIPSNFTLSNNDQINNDQIDIAECPLNITVDTSGDPDVRLVELVKLNSSKSTLSVKDTGNVLKDSNKQAKKRKRRSENERSKGVEVVEILDDDIIVLDDSFVTCDSQKTHSRLSESEVCIVEPSSVTDTAQISPQKDNQSPSSCTLSSNNAQSNSLHPSTSQCTNVLQNLILKVSDSECESGNENKNQNPNPPKKKKSKLAYHRPAHLVTPLTQPTPSLPATKVDSVSNIYNPNADSTEKRSGLRPIVIDGNNVALSHGKGEFSVKGLKICINFFEKRGHRQIKVFVPHYRKNRNTHDELHKMERQGILVTTPSRKVNGKTIASYDDRYIVQYAAEFGGVIVSTDNFRDLMEENPNWRETIEKRLLMFTWADDLLMFPQDPLGRNGPSLDDFLKFPDT